MKRIFLAGWHFNAGQRLHNLYMEKYLRKFGYEVILPQRESLKYFNGESFDVAGIVDSCMSSYSDKEVLYIGNADGSDIGMNVEYDFVIFSTGRAIIYRTDYRKIGINTMSDAKGTIFVYEPCFLTDLDQIDSYYSKLAEKIHDAVSRL